MLVNDDERETTGVLRILDAAKIQNLSCQSQIILQILSKPSVATLFKAKLTLSLPDNFAPSTLHCTRRRLITPLLPAGKPMLYSHLNPPLHAQWTWF